MGEFMYDINTGLIVLVLLVSMIVVVELGYRAGRYKKIPEHGALEEHINLIQAAVLGLLALLLGFTFSLSIQRFDSRSEAVVDETNAIGTVYLRVQFLPASLRDDALKLMREYIDLRVQTATVTTVDTAQRAALLAKAGQVQGALWGHAVRGFGLEPNAEGVSLFARALNDMFDSFGRRNAGLDRHVPELVLLLMYAAMLMASGIIGVASGMGGNRPSIVSYIMIAMIVVVVYVILDLDRPRRGLIRVDNTSLIELQTAIHADTDSMRK
jgi:hypothetical protein